MAADMTLEPWSRLVKLAPIATTEADLQAAANRWDANKDLYAAAADLWEERALSIDLSLEGTQTGADTLPGTHDGRLIKSVSQDGVTVTYEDSSASHSSRVAQHAQCLQRARDFRSRAKPKSPLLHPSQYNAWTGLDERELDEDIFVPVDGPL